MKEVLDPPFVHATPDAATPNLLRVLVLTTSFPLKPDSSSGIFVARLFDALPASVIATIVTPASRMIAKPHKRGRLWVHPVAYAPAAFRRLVHEPGGLPVALRSQPWLYLIVPVLLGSLFISVIRAAVHNDVIHANWAVNGLLAGIAGRLLGKPVVVTVRGEDVTRARRGGLSRQLLAATMRLSNKTVAVSTDMAAWIREEFGSLAEKVVVIENGVDDALLAIERNDKKPSADLIEYVTVGSLIPRKGVDNLIRALAASNHKRWCLHVVGDGPEHEALQRLAQNLDVASKVIFLGNVAPDRIVPLLANADAFLLGSYSEGRPNALVEAMAAGLPAVASRIPGVGELVEDQVSGLLASPGHIEEWTAATDRLATDPELRARLGTAARCRIRNSGLTWQAAARTYANLYRSLTTSQSCVES